MQGDYIKLNRKILEWEWYKNPNTKTVFIHCLLKANWKGGRYQGIDIPRGSFITSLSQIAKECSLSVQEVRTAIKHLKSTGEITDQSTAEYRIITIKNYDTYQLTNKPVNRRVTIEQQPVNNQSTGEQQSINRQVTTIEERKNNKKGRREERNNNIYYPHDEVLNNAFTDYVDFRNKIKKPLTQRAVELAMNKLDSLSGGDNDLAVEILNQSILNGWQGLFPLKQDEKPEKKKSTFSEWEDA